MYRDFFEFLGPGTAYLNAAVLGVFGARIDALGYAALALGVLLTIMMHSVSSRVCGPAWRLLPPLAFVVLIYASYHLGNHKYPALLLTLIGLSALMRTPGRPGAGLAAGAAFGLASLFTQDLGFGALAGALLALARRPGRPGAKQLVAGYLAPIVAVMGFFAAQAGARSVVYDCLVFPLTEYVKVNRLSLWVVPTLGPRTVAWVALFVGGVLGALFLLREGPGGQPGDPEEGRRRDERLVALVGLGVLVATSVRGMYAQGLAVRSVVLFVSLARALELLARHPHAAARWLTRGVLAVLGLGVLAGSLGYVVLRQRLEPMTLVASRAGTFWSRGPLPEIAWIESRTRPGDRTFFFPAGAGLYFMTRTRNATAFPYMLHGQYTVEQQQQALAGIAAWRPAVGVWYSLQGAPFPDTAGRLDTLAQGIFRDYAVERELPGGRLMLRRKGAPEAPPDPEQARKGRRTRGSSG
jgi:hypothetical protein